MKTVTLKDWLAEKGVAPADLAAELGVDHTTIWRLLNKGSKPTVDLAVAIERRTNGRVPVETWISG